MGSKRKSQPVMAMADVDIVIPVYGRFDLLKRCVDAIQDAAGPYTYTVTLVDNASPDRKEADEFYRGVVKPNVKVIRNQNNLGFPAACNRGAMQGKSKYIFFLNSDVILEPGSLADIVAQMDTQSKTGVVGMKLLFPYDVEGLNAQIRPAGRLQHIGISLNIHAHAHHPFVGWDGDHPKVNAQDDAWAVTGAALLVRRNLFRQVGGFDMNYGMGTYEDCHLCMAVRELGYNIKVNPRAVGIHYTGATAEKYHIGYPMNHNRQVFLDYWKDKLLWWDFFIL